MDGGVRGSGRAGRSGAGWWSQSEGQVLMSPVCNNLGPRDLPGLDES